MVGRLSARSCILSAIRLVVCFMAVEGVVRASESERDVLDKRFEDAWVGAERRERFIEQRLLRVDVLIVDELGFVPFDRVGGELLFNLITDRYERRATVVTTNLAFAEWVTVCAGDEKLTTALLDRLAHHATVLTTKGKSYRMRTRRAQEAHSWVPCLFETPCRLLTGGARRRCRLALSSMNETRRGQF
jgi:hypothetical protein